jgi:hypothetical protein
MPKQRSNRKIEAAKPSDSRQHRRAEGEAVSGRRVGCNEICQIGERPRAIVGPCRDYEPVQHPQLRRGNDGAPPLPDHRAAKPGLRRVIRAGNEPLGIFQCLVSK